MQIGKRIQRMRKRAGLTQAGLGKEVGMTGRNIRKIESDNSSTTLKTLNKVCGYFGYRVEYQLKKLALVKDGEK